MSIERIDIYIPLLDEGVPVLRPTLGEKIKGDIFKVLPTENYDPEDENWEFPPGSLVECKKQIKQGREILVAVRKYDDAEEIQNSTLLC